MVSLSGKSAVVIGASSGVGRAAVLALAAGGARVFAMARSKERLEALAREAQGEVRAVVDDASREGAIEALLAEVDPDFVVVSVGVKPRLATLEEHSWESFSAAWDTDVKAAFHVCQEALRRPLRPGCVVVILSSGAAIGGSPLSGGYAGAKRMQWLMADYAQRVSAARKLGLRFVAVVPKQLIAGTEIAGDASRAYSEMAGISQEAFMDRFGAPLDAEGVAAAISKVLRGEDGISGPAIGVSGMGLEAL